MEERDRRILEHVGLHRITVRSALELLFFDGGYCGNVVQRLRDQRLLRDSKLPCGCHSYYTLSKKSAALLELPASRASVGTGKLAEYSSFLWFSVIADARRRRLTPDQVEQALRRPAPPGEHCFATEDDGPVLYHLYSPAPETEPRSIERATENRLLESSKLPEVRGWIRSRSYGFAIIVDTETKRDTVSAHLDKAGVLKQARVLVTSHGGWPHV